MSEFDRGGGGGGSGGLGGGGWGNGQYDVRGRGREVDDQFFLLLFFVLQNRPHSMA